MGTPLCDELSEPKSEEKISDAEAAVYDRQIRLWGVDAQNRLRNASVLLIGLNGLGAEVAKNLMLSGLKRLILMDKNVVTENDRRAQFLIPYDCVGKNRAEASLARCQLLNPMVKVETDSSDYESKNPEFFQQFDLVCIITDIFDENVVKLDILCRNIGVKFMFGACFGWFGFCFSDFLVHEFVEEIAIQEIENGTGGEPAAKKLKSEDKTGDGNKMFVKTTEEFVSLSEALQLEIKQDGDENDVKRKWKAVPTGYFLLQILRKFSQKFKRFPSKSTHNEDVKELDIMKSHLIDELSTATRQNIDIPGFSPEYLLDILSPICAIVGGVMAQEVIKAMSKKDRPLNNFFFYNGLEFSGNVGKFPV